MRTREVKAADGSHYGWSIRCPACDDWHVLSGWSFDGNLERPTFTPSLLVTLRGIDDCGPVEHRCHSFIRDGRIEYLGDCTHAMAGQTVDLPEME